MKELKEEITQKNGEKEKIIQDNDSQIKELTQRIEEMSSEFADMLKDTLSKMQDRIEFANKDWKDDNDQETMKKFDHMTNIGAN